MVRQLRCGDDGLWSRCIVQLPVAVREVEKVWMELEEFRVGSSLCEIETPLGDIKKTRRASSLDSFFFFHFPFLSFSWCSPPRKVLRWRRRRRKRKRKGEEDELGWKGEWILQHRSVREANRCADACLPWIWTRGFRAVGIEVHAWPFFARSY